MKYVYIVFTNREIGSRHWCMDKIFETKKSAQKQIKKIMKKTPNGVCTIERERVHE